MPPTPAEREFLKRLQAANAKGPVKEYMTSEGEESWVPDTLLDYLPSMWALTEGRRASGRLGQDIDKMKPAPGSALDIARSLLPVVPPDIQRGVKQGQITPKKAERYREGSFDYVLRLLSLPTSAASGVVESAITGDTSAISRRIQKGEGLLGPGAELGKMAGEAVGMPGVGENIGWGAGLVAEIMIPILPGKATAFKAAASALRGAAPGSKVAGTIAKTIAPSSVAAQLFKADDVIRNLDRIGGFADAATAEKLLNIRNAPVSLWGDVVRTLPQEVGLGFLVPPPNVRGILATNLARKLFDDPAVLRNLGDDFIERLGKELESARAPGIAVDNIMKAVKAGDFSLATQLGKGGVNDEALKAGISRIIFNDLKGLDLPNYTQVTNSVWVPSGSVKKLAAEVKRRIGQKGPQEILNNPEITAPQKRAYVERIMAQSAARLNIQPLTRQGVIDEIQKLKALRKPKVVPEGEVQPPFTPLTKEQVKILAREERELAVATRPGQLKGSKIFEMVADASKGFRQAIGDPSVGLDSYGAIGKRIRNDIVRGLDGVNERFASEVRNNLKTMNYFEAVITAFRSGADEAVRLEKAVETAANLQAKEKFLTPAERQNLIRFGRTAPGGKTEEGLRAAAATPEEAATSFVRSLLEIKFGYGDATVETLITPLRAEGTGPSMVRTGAMIDKLMTQKPVQEMIQLFAQGNLRQGYEALTRFNRLPQLTVLLEGDETARVFRSALSPDISVNNLLTLNYIRTAMRNTLVKNVLGMEEDFQKLIPQPTALPSGEISKALFKVGDINASMAEALRFIEGVYGPEIKSTVSRVKTVEDFNNMVKNSKDINVVEALMNTPFARMIVGDRIQKAKAIADEDTKKLLNQLGDLVSGNLDAEAVTSIRTGPPPGLIVGQALSPARSLITSMAKTGLLGGLILPNLRYHMINALTAPTILIQTLGVPATLRLFDPKLLTGIQRVVQSINQGKVLGNMPFLKTSDDMVVVTDKFGREYTVDMIKDLILNNNVMASKISVEVERQAATEILSWARNRWPTAGKDTLRRAMIQYFGPLSFSGRGQNIWSEIANATDLRWRTGILVDALRRGVSTDDAVTMAREALFDYGSLSKFERDHISKYIWFWSFRRANLVNTFKLLVTEPELLKAGSLATRYRRDDLPGMEPEFTKNRLFVGLVNNPRNKKQWALYGPSLPIVEGVTELVETMTGLTAAMAALLDRDLKGAMGPAQSAFTQINPLYGGLIGIFTNTKIAFGDVKPDKNVKIDPTWLYLLSQNEVAFQTFNSIVPLKPVKKSQEKKDLGYYKGYQWVPADNTAERNLRILEYLTLMAGIKRNITEYSRLISNLSAGVGLEGDVSKPGRIFRPPGDPITGRSYLIGAIAEASGMVTPVSLEEYKARIKRHDDELKRLKTERKKK